MTAIQTTFRALFRAAQLAVWTLFMFLLLKAAKLRSRGADENSHQAAHYSRMWCKGICRILGIRLSLTGKEPPPGTFIAPNHLGYADIFAIGATIPCSFLTTTEIASWPIVGSLIKATGQIPMLRFDKGRDLVLTTRRIRDRLGEGTSVCVFLEGTSTGGDRVLPFFSPVMQAPIDAKADIVPTGIHWMSQDPQVEVSESIAYWKDHVFARHFWGFLGLQGVSCKITFGDPIAAVGWNRKALAELVHAKVESLVNTPIPTAEPEPRDIAEPYPPRRLAGSATGQSA